MFDINLPIYDMNLQLLPSNGNDFGPGNSEYSLAKSISSCDMLLAKIAVDFAR